MKPAVVGKTVISPLSLGTFVSYELRGDRLVMRFLGLLPVGVIGLSEVSELRLAAPGEPALFTLTMNALLYYFHPSAYRPVYVLRAGRRRCFLKLSRRPLQQLQSAIRRARHPARVHKKAA